MSAFASSALQASGLGPEASSAAAASAIRAMLRSGLVADRTNCRFRRSRPRWLGRPFWPAYPNPLLNICVNCRPILSVVWLPKGGIAETTLMNRIGSYGFSSPTRKTMGASQAEISQIAEDLKKAASELYFGQRRMQLTETIGDTIRPACPRSFGAPLVTLIYMSSTNCDISIAGCGVTLEDGTSEA